MFHKRGPRRVRSDKFQWSSQFDGPHSSIALKEVFFSCVLNKNKEKKVIFNNFFFLRLGLDLGLGMVLNVVLIAVLIIMPLKKCVCVCLQDEYSS